MFFKYNSFTGRISPTEAQAAYQPQVLSKLPKEVLSEAVAAPLTSGAGMQSPMERMLRLQGFFQKGDVPVFLRGAKDLVMYRGVMVGSVVGLSITFYAFYQLATGKMKKKER